ncbi:uncharacterized protein LTR77_000065 [Saxophila tyrrhenica]|uniref:Ribosomal RNA-processing protein 43 n=1 Tax=Saxophila tyrrhenica TaxID=1690608 RepID=A0AAV9PLY7_9PEZI|nr:hypothetical protein LTR77_000065 [Saxophila tyrrhenica]
MANGTTASSGLSFPRETFAKLTPGPYLHAHLKQPSSIRPNGRQLDEHRIPTVNAGSLTHSNGSAVVRCGDTAIVCGVRAEILLASDLPHPPPDDLDDDDLVEHLGILVPNVELSTGCSPAHLPGNPPGPLAQSLTYRILALLHSSDIIDPNDLRIKHLEANTDEDLPDEGPRQVTKAYWVLYIDILAIALDGNAIDTAWTATMAAFQNTILPKAHWDQDREMIVCSPRLAEATGLRLRDMPVASTSAIFTTASPLKSGDQAESWVLADPDGFEEDVCAETLTVVLVSRRDGTKSLLRVEKSGGAVVTTDLLARYYQYWVTSEAHSALA